MADEEVRTFKIDYQRDGSPLTRNMEGMPSRVLMAIARWVASEPDLVLESITALGKGD